MGFLDLVFPGKTKMEVAANIINANYNLHNLPPDINKSAFHDIIDKLQRGYNQKTPEDAYFMFLGEPRMIQLNILALAYNNINIAPLLKGEYWRYIKNPFLPTIYSEMIFESVKNRIKKQYRVSIVIPIEPFSINELYEIFQLDGV
jgi:hypothetical protein